MQRDLALLSAGLHIGTGSSSCAGFAAMVVLRRARRRLQPAPLCSADSAETPSEFYRTPQCLQIAPVAGEGDLVVDKFPLTYEGYTYQHSRIVYVKGRPKSPVVLVHPNYAGLKQFDIDQACFLAKVGYVGLAVDLYRDEPAYAFRDREPSRDGSREEVKQRYIRHIKGAFAAMNDLLLTPKRWRGLMEAYVQTAFTHPAVRSGLAGGIGYCFGGQCLLEQVRAGHPLQAVVSFHGLLQSRPLRPRSSDGRPSGRLTAEEFAKDVDVAGNNYNTSCKVLIENGDLDDHVPPESVEEWKKEMDAHGIDWRFHNHFRAKHGFALAPGVVFSGYNEAADRRSTLSMLSLFAEVWPDFQQFPVEANACGTKLGQSIGIVSKL